FFPEKCTFDRILLACREGATRFETTRTAYYLSSRIDRVGNAARIAIHSPECGPHSASPEKSHKCLIPSFGGGTGDFSGMVNPTCPSIASSECAEISDCSSIPKERMQRHVPSNGRL